MSSRTNRKVYTLFKQNDDMIGQAWYWDCILEMVSGFSPELKECTWQRISRNEKIIRNKSGKIIYRVISKPLGL